MLSYDAGPTDTPILEETIGANFERTVAAYPDTLALVDRALAQAPEDGEALYLGAVLQRMKGDLPAALVLIGRLIALQPRLGRAWQERGHCLRQMSQREPAVAAYAQAVEFNPLLTASWKMLAAHYGEVDPPRAREALTKVREVESQPPGLMAALAAYYDQDFTLAEERVRAYLLTVPDDPVAMRLLAELGNQVACVLVQSPNYLGVLQDVAAIQALAHKAGALTVVACPEPLAFGLVKSPGSQGADIVAGEGIGLASGPSLGGPGVGLFAARSEHLRQMPGRLVGETVDQSGRRGYVLTLSTREQHIRREKATSNICTNQGLIALAFAIHVCLLGKSGFRRLAEINLAKSEYLKQRLSSLRGFKLAVSGPTFNEFAIHVRGRASDAAAKLRERGIFAGVPLDQPSYELPMLPDAEKTLLVATSERHQKADLDRLVSALDEVCP